MGWWPFGSRSFLSPEAEASHYEGWNWLLRHCGGLADLALSPLVTPTRSFFPATEAEGHARAEYVLDCVKRHARLADWPCRLIEQAPRPELRVGRLATLKFDEGHAAGTFSLDGNAALITYDPASLKDPLTLVATFAHEIAHYRLAGVQEPPPGGEEGLEPITDLTTVYLGFGLFGANAAFNFNQHQDLQSQGWSTSSLGYLGERDWVFALAVFLTLREQPAASVKPFLKDYLFSDLRRAMAYLGRGARIIADLKSGSHTKETGAEITRSSAV